MRRAVDLGITPDVTKIPPAGERLTSFDFKGDNSHRAPPVVRSGNAAPGPKGESNRLARARDRARSARSQRLTPSLRCVARLRQLTSHGLLGQTR